MSLKAVFVVLLLGLVAWPSQSHAEKVKTNQSTKLYSRAGEQSPVLLTLKSGQAMTLLAKDGRWLKVRVSGRTGWIPRSKVDLPEEDEDIARNTRRRPFVDGRGTKRGFGGEGGPDDRVGADATGAGEDTGSRKRDTSDDGDGPRARGKKPARDDDDDDKPAKRGKSDDGDDAGDDDSPEATRPMAHVSKPTSAYNDPSSDSDVSFTAEPRTALYVVETKGKWTAIENDEGELGYVLTSKLELEDAAPGGKRARSIDLRGRLGVALVHQSVSTPGGTTLPPDNYGAGSSSLTVALGGEVLYPYSKRYWLGGELAYDFDKAVPGISYMKTTTSFTYHNFNLRAVGGYDLHKSNGMLVFARLGYHYDSFQVADVADFTKNTAKLPNQIISAPTLGGALVIPRLTGKLALKVSLDTILLGASVSQTKNLEDGTGPSAKAVFLGGVLTYRWKPKMNLQATYDLGYTSISFSGMPPAGSTRGHTGTGVSSASDLNNTVSFGISYEM
jgi:SH3-like domain-containing protein